MRDVLEIGMLEYMLHEASTKTFVTTIGRNNHVKDEGLENHVRQNASKCNQATVRSITQREHEIRMLQHGLDVIHTPAARPPLSLI